MFSGRNESFLLETQALELQPQALTADAEGARSLGAVARGFSQRLLDHVPLQTFDVFRERACATPPAHAWGGEPGRQVPRADRAGAREQARALELVLQLAHVARPAIFGQKLHCGA